jgi:hypothetical protein
MRYLKLYEKFRTEELEEIEIQKDQELSDKTIDDVLNPDFFSEEEEKEKEESEEVFQDKRGVYHINNWNVY